jgi:putative addiction module component (TIGR02574 family)
MTRIELEQEVLRLPVEDRLALAEAIWESLEREPSSPPLSDWQQDLLDQRLAADDQHPDAGSPWDEVKRRILAGL